MANNSASLLPMRDGVAASTVTLPTGSWSTLLGFLCDNFKGIPPETWRARMDAGLVTDSKGRPLGAETAFQAQSVVHYYRALEQETPIPFEERILFQDDFIIAVDKPHFLPVMPAGKYLQETLLVRLKRKTGIDALTPMHRLDRETAGVMLFVIKPETRGAYQSLFLHKRVQKEYLAIAPYREDSALPLTRRSRMQVSGHFMRMQEVAGAPNSETHIELVEHRNGLGRYALRPVTGKKHQLRVHMAALGMPILGDRIYPDYIAEQQESFENPLQLLASEIAFIDPILGCPRTFQSGKTLRFPADRN
jgi:tRNA pseudouridine32 synthase/23S rRNA pseudouridine746 synthase